MRVLKKSVVAAILFMILSVSGNSIGYLGGEVEFPNFVFILQFSYLEVCDIPAVDCEFSGFFHYPKLSIRLIC